MKTRLVLLAVTPPIVVAGWLAGVTLDLYRARTCAPTEYDPS